MITQLGEIQSFTNNHPVIFFLLLLWSVTWKALALWKSARIGHKSWFVILLILNLFGIPEIIYIYFIARKFEVKSETGA